MLNNRRLRTIRQEREMKRFSNYRKRGVGLPNAQNSL